MKPDRVAELVCPARTALGDDAGFINAAKSGGCLISEGLTARCLTWCSLVFLLT